MESDKFNKLFPLKSIENVVELFKHELIEEAEPDLAFLSLVVGSIENTLTNPQQTNQNAFPPVISVENLYKKFKSIVTIAELQIAANNNNSHKKSRNVNTTTTTSIQTTDAPKYATREIIKRVSDVIWNSLMRTSYK